MGSTVRDVRLSLVPPFSSGVQIVKGGHEQPGAFRHRTVNDVAAARALSCQHRSRHPEREEHAAPAEVAGEREGRNRALSWSDRMERAAQSYVVEIMSR